MSERMTSVVPRDTGRTLYFISTSRPFHARSPSLTPVSYSTLYRYVSTLLRLTQHDVLRLFMCRCDAAFCDAVFPSGHPPPVFWALVSSGSTRGVNLCSTTTQGYSTKYIYIEAVKTAFFLQDGSFALSLTCLYPATVP
jgi:hypothetical protein